MGFSSEWVSIMKGIVNEAFTPEPVTPNLKGVFIDGQIQLMKPQFINNMDLFYKIQYANIINRYFKDGPDDMVVVLAFDDYNNVPCSKSMTQMKRKQRVTDVLPFTETDDIPMNDCPKNWEGAMCNRVFKTKLIKKITEKMGRLVALRKQQRLIVDFIGDPIEYSTVPGSMSMGGDSPCFARYISDVPPIGEADCKMPRWIDYISFHHPNKSVDVIVEATDSDYIMIAMLHYEKQVRMVMAGNGTMGRISIRRIQCNAKEHAAGEKRPAKAKKRVMEYIHIPLLCEVMTSIMGQFFEGNTPMRCLTALIALGGTDFCRNTPRIGAHRIWELLPLVLGKNKKLDIFKNDGVVEGCSAMDCEWKVFDEDVICDQLLANIYNQVYTKHCIGWDGRSFQSLSDIIKSDECKLSAGTKEEFPTMGTVATNTRNASWNLIYWLCAVDGVMKDVCPDPIDPKYGYALDSKGKPQWLDVVLMERSGA